MTRKVFSIIFSEPNENVKKAKMQNLNKICVLNAFSPYLLILKAYNLENFRQINRRRCVKNIAFACGVAVFFSLIPVVSFSAICWLFNSNNAIQHLNIVPIIFTILQIFMKWVVLTMKNHIISEKIERLQNVIGQRKFLVIC